MINEQRVRAMTRLATYEKHHGSADEKVNSYFKTDYISGQLLRSFICGTVACFVLAAVYGFYNFENLMLTIYSMDLKAFGMRVLTMYLVFMGILMAITIGVYAYRYHKARKNLEKYYRDLNRLSDGYRKA